MRSEPYVSQSQPLPADTAPPLSDDPPPSGDGGGRLLPWRFHGTAGAYFGIWIVNLLLTVATLGVWSAWAKVRAQRWFNANTEVDGHVFEYHATGWQIFKGRLLALAVVVLAALPGIVWPQANVVLTLVLVVAMPWAINSALRFRARVTSWRNVRFDFRGSYGRAFLLFVVMTLASLLTLGLLLPLATRMRVRYLVGGHSWGGAPMRSSPPLGRCYRAGAMALAVGLAGAAAAGGIVYLLAGLVAGGTAAASGGRSVAPVAAIMAAMYGGLIVGALYYAGRVHQLMLDGLQVQGGHALQARISAGRYLWITVSGLLATVFSLGLLYPWARVRRYRYVATRLALSAAPGLDGFVSTHRDSPSAFGTEFGALEGLTDGLA